MRVDSGIRDKWEKVVGEKMKNGSFKVINLEETNKRKFTFYLVQREAEKAT